MDKETASFLVNISERLIQIEQVQIGFAKINSDNLSILRTINEFRCILDESPESVDAPELRAKLKEMVRRWGDMAESQAKEFSRIAARVETGHERAEAAIAMLRKSFEIPN